MADSSRTILSEAQAESPTTSQPLPFQPPKTLDEARALARERFKSKLQRGEQIGDCACHDDELTSREPDGSAAPSAPVAGVRFRDSGRTYYFEAHGHSLQVGDWVVVETGRGREAGRVVIAPHQIRLNLLQGELKPILRRLGPADVEKMDTLKRQAVSAVKTFGVKIRQRGLPMKPISADYSFDGAKLTLHFSAPDRVDFRDLARDLASTFGCRVELKQVGPRDEARLLGGLGRCGRTLCCSSWLPVFPEISMNMAKTQDLPLNPSKVSGVCGRLLCCLSYENEQYRQMKAIMPRLGQSIETPAGPGLVVSLQVLKELVTVRLDADNTAAVFPAADLGFRKPEPAPAPASPPVSAPVSAPAPAAVPPAAGAIAPLTLSPNGRAVQPTDGQADEEEAPRPDELQRQPTGRRRRRRRGGGSGQRPSGESPPPQS